MDLRWFCTIAISIVISQPIGVQGDLIDDIENRIFQSRSKQNSSADRIINGDFADAGEYPWHAVLRYKGYFVCGGTLVNRRLVVTAAHCVSWDTEQKRGKFQVTLGLTKFSDPSKSREFRVSKIKMHPKFGVETLQFDVAVMELNRPAKFSKYIQRVPAIANSNFVRRQAIGSDRCYVIGFGIHDQDDPSKYSKRLRELNIELVGANTCRQFIEEKHWGDRLPPVNSGHICNLDKHGSDCIGDSGGSVGCYDKDGKFVMVGMVSYGPLNCLKPPSVYVKLSNVKQWILGTL